MTVGVSAGELSVSALAYYPSADTTGLINTPRRITITEEVNRHTLFTIEHGGAPENFTRSLLTGSPVEIVTQSRMGSRSWFGYITEVKPGNPSPGDSPTGYATLITAVGITYPGKQTSNKVWSGGTLASYMSKIVYDMGLVGYIQEDGVHQTVPQAGRTYWETLLDMAARAGLDVFVTGSTVNALSPANSISAFRSEAPTLFRVVAEGNVVKADSLSSLVMSESSLPPQGTRASTVDPVTGRVLVAQQGVSLFNNYGPNITARSLDTLEQMVNKERVIANLPLTAMAEGPGNTLLGAGKPVFLDDRGTRNWWVAQKVEHELSPATGRAITRSTLKRHSSLGDKIVAPPVPPERNHRRLLKAYCLCQEMDPDLVDSSKASFITNQKASPGTRPEFPQEGDVYRLEYRTSATAYAPVGAWYRLPQWRAKGKCNWL